MSEVPGDERLLAGRYRLMSPLGEGGMGVVWRARDELLGREVAVKEVRAPAALGTDDERRLYARLEREAWAAARVSHRNVVTVYDVATQDGRPWIVMELVRGLALSDVLDAEGPLAPARAARIGAEILAALRAAHDAGVLHRDVKPGNVLIGNDGRVVLSDFGIATVEGSSNLTMTGELIGSPEFLAPERALGRTPGPESDLWSLGVLLYAAVEGNSPFRQNTPLSTLRAVVDEELPLPHRAGPLTPVIAGLLRKDPAQRLSAAEAERELRVVAAGGAPRTAPPPGADHPTVAAGSPTTAVHPQSRTPAPVPGPATASTTAPMSGAAPAAANGLPPDRARRAAVVLIAGVAVLLLAVSGLAWALVNSNRDPGGGKDKGSSTPSTPGTSSTSPGSTASAPGGGATDDGTSDDGGDDGGDSGGDGGTYTPPQSVEVHVQGVRDSYAGTCPPAEAQAPAFRATITVARTPVGVDYRWVTRNGDGDGDGSGSGSGWRTLDFAAGRPKQKQVDHIELTYEQGGTHHDRIRVEIRSPVEVRSHWIDFSVTCDQETPTDEVSSSAGTASAVSAAFRRDR
ncbi:protein kinase [Streptomyces sp. NBC_00390]|uniref:serine/threonine-protein kinase n=1 Tax=Streptomyces sp. NBC_00390 TaxID=2975736 RepID=UPI002E1D305D